METWKNIDAPVGLSTRLNIVHTKADSIVLKSSTVFSIMENRRCDINIVGGGGGGGGPVYIKDDFIGTREWDYWSGGGGGGAGYLNTYRNQYLIGDYTFTAGIGGSGGGDNSNGSAGGTSIIKNTNYYAIGGEGGYMGNSSFTTMPIAKGGLGNGGRKGENGSNSSVSFAGGGGGGGSISSYTYLGGSGNRTYGGSPYGGRGGANDRWNSPTAGTNGGGGGGASSDSSSYGASGGSGLLIINFLS